MRFMLTVRIPPEKGNALVKDGTLGRIMQSILEELRPEAAYFTTMEGARGGFMSSTWTTCPRSRPWRNPFSSDWARPCRSSW